MLFESAEIATFTPEERVKYQNDMTTERDRYNQLVFAEAKGREEGREEERLRSQAYLQSITEKLRQKGFSEEEIAAVMGK